MLKFYITVSSSSYIADYLMDLVYNWYDDRYQSEVPFSNTLIHTYDLKVKATLRTFMSTFCIKVFNVVDFPDQMMDLLSSRKHAYIVLTH